MSTTAPSDDLAERLTGPDPVLGREAEAEVRVLGRKAFAWLEHLVGTDRWDSVPRAARLFGEFGESAADVLLARLRDDELAHRVVPAFRFMEPGHSHQLVEALGASPRGKTPQSVIGAIGEYGDANLAVELADAAKQRGFEPRFVEQAQLALERLLCAQREPRAASQVLYQLESLITGSGEAAPFPLHASWYLHRIELGWLDAIIASFESSQARPVWWGERRAQWLGIARAARAVPVLGAVAADQERPLEVRVAALAALADNARDGALDAVAHAAPLTSGLDEAGASRYHAAVDAAVATLAHQGEDPAALAREVFARATEANNAAARANALRSLGRCRDAADASTLENALSDTDWLVRGAAAVGLAALAGSAAAERLAAAYAEASEGLERIEIAAALALAQPEMGVGELNDRLCDPSTTTPWALVRPIRDDIVRGFLSAPQSSERGEAWAEVLGLAGARAPAGTAAAAGGQARQAEDEEVRPDEPEPPRGRPPAQADTEATEDQLGRERLVSVLVAMLDDDSQGTPFTFGLFGGWGEGKSSVLRQLERRLRSGEVDHRFAIAWFNAWQYEKTDNLAAGLVQESVRALRPTQRRERLALTARFAWRRNRSKVLWALVLLAASVAAIVVGALSDALGGNLATILVGTGLASALSIAATVIVKLYRHPVAAQLLTYLRLPDYAQQLGMLPAMRDELEQLWAVRRHGAVDRLVVVVDDLDRCSTEAITATLDAVRLVMDLDGVVVILALDERICLQAVAHEYKELATAERTRDEIARDFLAKIVQLPIRLEAPLSVQDYITHDLFPDEPSGPAQTPARAVNDAAALGNGDASLPPPSPADAAAAYASTQAAAGTYPIAAGGALEALLAREVMRETPDERTAFHALASAAGVTNPRQLRRLRNTYRFIKAMAPGLHWRKLMAMLFWQELLYASSPQEFAARSAATTPAVGDGDSISAALAEAIGKAFDGVDEGDIRTYRDAVRGALLPRLDV